MRESDARKWRSNIILLESVWTLERAMHFQNPMSSQVIEFKDSGPTAWPVYEEGFARGRKTIELLF